MHFWTGGALTESPASAARETEDVQLGQGEKSAIGGALPVLDERTALKEWQGGSRSPPLGGSETYPITGA